MAEPTPSFPSPALPPSTRARRRWRLPSLLDLLFFGLVAFAGFSVLVLAYELVNILFAGASPAIHQFGIQLLTGRVWNPVANVYGLVPFVYGTLITSALALLIAVPLALGTSIFLTAYAPQWLRRPAGTAIELLAAVPSVIYGFWGIFVLAPYLEYNVDPQLQSVLGWTGAFSGPQTSLNLFTASVIVAVMIVPTVSAVSRDALAAVPAAQREAALGLGATTWESARVAMLPYCRSAIVGGIVLGLGRALGETMAVAMTIGNSDVIPTSLLSQGQTLASLIANEFYSQTGGPIEVHVLLAAGLVLLAIALVVNVIARVLVWKVLRVGGSRSVE